MEMCSQPELPAEVTRVLKCDPSSGAGPRDCQIAQSLFRASFIQVWLTSFATFVRVCAVGCHWVTGKLLLHEEETVRLTAGSCSDHRTQTTHPAVCAEGSMGHRGIQCDTIKAVLWKCASTGMMVVGVCAGTKGIVLVRVLLL